MAVTTATATAVATVAATHERESAGESGRWTERQSMCVGAACVAVHSVTRVSVKKGKEKLLNVRKVGCVREGTRAAD